MTRNEGQGPYDDAFAKNANESTPVIGTSILERLISFLFYNKNTELMNKRRASQANNRKYSSLSVGSLIGLL